MSSENTITGRGGRIVVDDQLVTKVTQWRVTRTLATKSEWGDSDSGGHTNRAAGRMDSTFTTEGKYDAMDEVFDLFQAGDICYVDLWMRTTAPNLYYTFPRALCDNFDLLVNVDTQEVVGWTANWGEDGISYQPGAAGAPVRTLPT